MPFRCFRKKYHRNKSVTRFFFKNQKRKFKVINRQNGKLYWSWYTRFLVYIYNINCCIKLQFLTETIWIYKYRDLYIKILFRYFNNIYGTYVIKRKSCWVFCYVCEREKHGPIAYRALSRVKATQRFITFFLSARSVYMNSLQIYIITSSMISYTLYIVL